MDKGLDLKLPSIPGLQTNISTTLGINIPSIPVTISLNTLPPIKTELKVIPLQLPLNKLLPIVETEAPGIFPDMYELINVSWYNDEPVVRIGSIGDGSCFFHAVLNGYYPPYQNNNKLSYRMDLVRKLRRDIAYTLQMKDPDNHNIILWESAAKGQFSALYQQQLMGLDFTDIFNYPVNFSLNGLQRLFNSTNYLGNEVYQYASDMLGIDIYVMRLTNKDLHVHQNTSIKGMIRKVVIISGNGNHYETIGVDRNNLFQTVFDQNDPFIIALRSRIDDEEGG